MTQRGRKSAAALSVAGVVSPNSVCRPDAPYDLTDEEADVWRRIVDDLQADWFTAKSYDVLSQYCRHVVGARRIAQLIKAMEDSDEFDVKEYDQLLKMQVNESRIIASLGTKMRITHQAQYSDKKTSRSGGGGRKKPWES